MRRLRSGFDTPGFPVVIAAVVNLFLLICFLVWLPVHRLPRYGMSFYLPEAHYRMASFSRDNLYIVTVTAGENARAYAGGVEVPGGIQGLQARLDEWAALRDKSQKKDVTVMLEFDPAVSAGEQQRLIDMVLTRGFRCSLIGRPSVN
ncbi:MAG: hypothetical protein E7033_07245 [Akkermansiaceae bacterium]|nr:hypothetical protein [Akkermansiaceae bacterium]